MRTVCDKDMCAGCMACLEKCPKDCISIVDSLLAYNAVIDEEKCINCNACHNVCQANNPAPGRETMLWREGWASDNEIRRKSSSGGFACAIEKAFVAGGGIVCSCTFKDGRFGFDFAETQDDIRKFVGSKYVKSNPAGIYKKISKELRNGRKVLFVGLPCQVAALINFVGEKNAENLYTVDLICHGTPSPKVLETFLNQHGTDINSLKNISFRSKAKFHVKGDSKYFSTPGTLDKYSIAFLNCVNYTENCYTCNYAKRERVSDLTIGDNWGSTLPVEELRKGVSLVLCQTDKGRQMLDNSQLELREVDVERAVARNGQLKHPSIKPMKRQLFFDSMAKDKSFDCIVWKIYPKNCVKQIIKGLLIKLKLWGGSYMTYCVSVR